MADFIDNFNFDPADNKQTSVSYTVPPGMYAIVSVTLNADAYGHSDWTSGATPTFNDTSNSNSTTITLNLKSGEIITKIETAASGTDSSSILNERAHVVGQSIAQVLVNSNVVGEVTARAISTITTNSSTGHTANVSGSAKVTWQIAEYNKQGA